MRRQRAAWALMPVMLAPAGIAIGRFHLIAPTPGMFFALGVLATLSAGGIIFGVIVGRRIARDGLTIGN